jgi:Rab GDP dissociation inhibitor
MYGLGELPQGFARLSAIYGGTYMLNRPIEGAVYGDDGRVVGVKASDPDDPEGAIKDVKCKMVIADPSYFPDKVKKVGQVVRAICILDHPLPKTKPATKDNKYGGALSAQIIIPANQIDGGGKKCDIYVGAVSMAHNVAAEGKWLAFVSTTVETENPEAELQLGFELCGPILERFVAVSDLVEPVEDGSKDGIFISSSYDATSHFETTFDDINSLYKRITGAELDLTKVSDEEGADGAGAAQ